MSCINCRPSIVGGRQSRQRALRNGSGPFYSNSSGVCPDSFGRPLWTRHRFGLQHVLSGWLLYVESIESRWDPLEDHPALEHTGQTRPIQWRDWRVLIVFSNV